MCSLQSSISLLWGTPPIGEKVTERVVEVPEVASPAVLLLTSCGEVEAGNGSNPRVPCSSHPENIAGVAGMAHIRMFIKPVPAENVALTHAQAGILSNCYLWEMFQRQLVCLHTSTTQILVVHIETHSAQVCIFRRLAEDRQITCST